MRAGALVASMVVLAAVPPPSVNSAPYYDPSSGYSYSMPPPAAVSSSAAETGEGLSEYEATVRKYEPWAFADDADTAGRYDVRSHMMGQE